MEILLNTPSKYLGKLPIEDAYEYFNKFDGYIDIISDDHTDDSKNWTVILLFENASNGKTSQKKLELFKYRIVSETPYSVAIRKDSKSGDYLKLEDIFRQRRRRFVSEYIDAVDCFTDEELKDFIFHTLRISSGFRNTISRQYFVKCMNTFSTMRIDPSCLSIQYGFSKPEGNSMGIIKFHISGCTSYVESKMYKELYELFVDCAKNVYKKHYNREISIKYYRIINDHLNIYFNSDKRCTKIYKNFIGNISELSNFLDDHNQLVGIKITSNYLNDGYEIRIFIGKTTTSNKTYEDDIDGYLICPKSTTEDSLYRLFEKNIKTFFNYIMNGSGYISPFSSEDDTKTGVHLSFEKDLIKNTICKGKSINPDKLKRLYETTNTVAKFSVPNSIRVDFRNIEKRTTSDKFDCIYATLPIVTKGKTRKEIIDLISSNKKDFDRLILEKIQSKARFIKSNLSMNYFELSNVTLTRQYELIYVFDIKKEIREILEE